MMNPKKYWLLFLLCIVGIGFLFVVPTFQKKPDAVIAVASNFKPAAERLALLYFQEAGYQLQIISGSSGKLYAQINQGAPFDAYFSAEDNYPKKLINDGKAKEGTEFVYARGRLVVVAEKELGDELESALLKADKIGVANPKHAPYGFASITLLKKMSLYALVQAQLVYAENIAQVYQFIFSHSVNAAFISESLVRLNPAALSEHWRVLPVDLLMYPPIKQSCVLLTNNAAAKSFLAFIKRDDVKKEIIQMGYSVNGAD
jgi:molybdate transport system substrate-binding protein